VHLPPVVVAALANVELVEDRTVFRLSKTGHLYDLLTEAARTAGVTIPERVAFHIFRHTYGALDAALRWNGHGWACCHGRLEVAPGGRRL
jgi:integrase